MNLAALNDDELLRYAAGQDDMVATPLERELAKRLEAALDAADDLQQAPARLVSAREVADGLIQRINDIANELAMHVAEPLGAVIALYHQE